MKAAKLSNEEYNGKIGMQKYCLHCARQKVLSSRPTQPAFDLTLLKKQTI